MSILNSENAMNWLRQFSIGDQQTAAELLSRFIFVSRDEFTTGLREIVLLEAYKVPGPVGLYAERALPRRPSELSVQGGPLPLFSETEEKIRRAIGKGPEAIEPATGKGHDVGSEGIVAQLISELCRKDKTKFFSHPGPEVIRNQRIRHLWVLTDIIASGSRAESYIEAAWQVRSVRSWWSGKFFNLGVLAYAATNTGASRVARHSSKPMVRFVMPCPTIKSIFKKEKRRYEILCVKYDPASYKKPRLGVSSLGYGNTGALMAFAHGAPNNTPYIFHKAGGTRSWIPLFPERVTTDIDAAAFQERLTEHAISSRLEQLGQRLLAKSPISASGSREVKKRFLILAAMAGGNRLDVSLAQATGLTLPEVAMAYAELEALGWVVNKRLTDQGDAELREARRQTMSDLAATTATVDVRDRKPYYPISLRPPVPKPS